MPAERRKRVAVFVTGAFSAPDRLDWISGHVQIPLMAAKILSTAGYHVTLITTREDETHCLPYALPAALDVCVVQHASGWAPDHRIYARQAFQQVRQLRALLCQKRFDLIHFFGGTATGWLLCALKCMGIHAAAMYSPLKRPARDRSALYHWGLGLAFRRACGVLATSDYVGAGWAAVVGEEKVRVLYPGIMRELDMGPEIAEKNAVLFWRDGSYDNGVDVAMASFRRLAPKYPATRFVIAVRAQGSYRDQLRQLSRDVENIEVYFYPYREGVSLAGLLGRAHFAIGPFRRLTINPQIALLETLHAGVPVITTAIESNAEVVQHEENGLLIPPADEGALSSAIERLLQDATLLTRLRGNARHSMERRWNWNDFGRQLLQAYGELP
jgi:glycosyltransferase involved in cell wall biosynthesis